MRWMTWRAIHGSPWRKEGLQVKSVEGAAVGGAAGRPA
jgi:hypothetical protein